MAKKCNRALLNVAIVSSTTVVSRIFGFLRDVTFFSCFGLSEIGGAFLLAFSFPNLFRRLLGEGALSSAIVPVLSSQYVEHGKESMLKLFTHVLVRLLLILFCALIFVYGILHFADLKISDIKWKMAITFTSALLPYMVFVCLAAVVAAALNVLGRFFVASINQVWMNLAMIVSILIGRYALNLDGVSLANCLVAGVIIGGAIQLIIPLATVFYCGWRPWLDKNIPNLRDGMKDVWRLFLPGVFGAAVEQLNLLISRTIAYSFSAAAVPLLYLASRLVELPAGVFGVAIATVFFPRMAKIVSLKASSGEINAMFNNCLISLIWILLPSAIGLFSLKSEILYVFFAHGNFLASDIVKALPIISIYCISMLFSSSSSLFIKGFHSFKDTKTPVFVGLTVLVINVVLSLSLMRICGIFGFAIANACAAISQFLLLCKLFKKKIHGLSILSDSYMVILCGAFMVAISAFSSKILVGVLFGEVTRISALVTIFVAVAVSLVLYLFVTRRLILKAFHKQVSIN